MTKVVLVLAGLAAVAAALVLWITLMPGKSYKGPFAPLSSEEARLREALSGHVHALAQDIGGRSVTRSRELDAAADYIRARLSELGLSPHDQPFLTEGVEVRNVEAELRGRVHPERIIIVGAHYDTADGLPGANDNATGVAATLEIARSVVQRPPDSTVRFVFFVNEEPPYFQTEYMGSLVYAQRCKQRGEQITAMLSLETIGYYSDDAGSQTYPAGLSLGFPKAANFIGFVANLESRALLTRALGTFRSNTKFPSEGAAAPSVIPGIAWSDHWAFWQKGYSAIMITDTAPFRYRYYHTAEDTPDKIEFDHFARVTRGLMFVVANLAA